MIPILRDNPILWHFAPWKSKGTRGRLFWFLVLLGMAMPVLAAWLVGSNTPLAYLDSTHITSKNSDGLFNRIGGYWGFPVVYEWGWIAALVGLSVLSWLLAVSAMYLLRLNLINMGLLEQVYLTGLDRNRAAIGTVAWGALVGLFILLAAFLFQVTYTGYFYPVALGRLINLQWVNGALLSQPILEAIPFGVGYACVLLAASLAVWSQALRGALRQSSAPWFDAPRCLMAGAMVFFLILLGVVMLGILPEIYWIGITFDGFTYSLIALSLSVIVVMLFVQIRSISRMAGRVCFGPVNPELFVRDDWWESECAHRRIRSPLPRTPLSDWVGQVTVSLSGVALALFVLSVVAMNVDLREMTLKYPYVVAILGIYAPAGVALYELLRGPLGNHRPVRGHLIRTVLHGAWPMLIAVGIGLAFFLWIAAGLKNSIRSDMDDLVPWVTVAFGIGFGLLAHVILLPRRGRRWLLAGAAAAAGVLLITPLIIGGIALFGIGLAALCSLPSGLMSVLMQRVHDNSPSDEIPAPSVTSESLLVAGASVVGDVSARTTQGDSVTP